MIRRCRVTTLIAVLSIPVLAACGKKGPPLEPLRLTPGPVVEMTGRRSAQEVELRFSLPTGNSTGAERIDLDHVEVYAVTVAPGAVTPPNRDILTKARIVGTIPVRPPLVDGAPEPPPSDTRPSPGDRVTFVEKLSDDKLIPLPLPPASALPKPEAPPAAPAPQSTAPVSAPGAMPTVPAGAAAPGAPPPTSAPPAGTTATAVDPTAPATPAAAPGAAAPAAAQPAAPPPGITVLTRIYVVRGISRAGRPGPASPRVSVPLDAIVAPPTAVVAQMPSERAVALEWTPPVAEAGAPPLAYNVYRPDGTATPLNPSPLTDAKFETPAGEFGKEQCFVLRTIQTVQNVTIESDASAPACLTPRDTFAPAAPAGLRAVAEEGGVNLVWEPNAETDLAGYFVLRGESPETLQPLMAKPIVESTYRDTSAAPGTRYVYAIVAVDGAAPPNRSAASAPEAVTAR